MKKSLFFYCKDVAHLVSQAEDSELSLLTRMRLKMHLLMCGVCLRFARQIRLLRRSMILLRDSELSTDDTKLDEEQRQRLQAAVRHGEFSDN